MSALMPNRKPSHSRRAFSLVELVVVIGIIVLIISIVLPALAGARNAAKVEATRSLVNQFTNAVASFKQDKSRLPGYFSVRDMGDTQNATTGFSAMQNAMLDLAGGITSEAANAASKIYAVTPSATAPAVNVSLDLIGAGGKSYFPVLGKNYYKKQDGVEGGERISSNDIKQIPEVVDAWGQPLLLWVADTTVAGPIQSISDNNNNALIRKNSTNAAGTPPARFYWNSNAAFLTALGGTPPYIGTQRKQQYTQSWITDDHPNYIKNLSILLGSPTGPVGITKPYDQILPSTQRGDYIVQSSGKNYIYMGLGENTKGYAANNTLLYGSGFKDPSGGARTDSNGKPTSVDIMAQSDDIWQAGN